MRESISIKGVTSYHPSEAEVIDISKQNTLIFGLNGTGKSTISKFLYDLDRFPSCNFNIDGSFSPTVYNQSFIDDNFVNSSMQEGVFTLSKDNADLEARVVEKSKLREKLLAIYNKIKSDISVAKQAQDDALNSAIDEVFKQKHVIEKSSLEPFLKSFKTPKRKFYEQVERQKGENSQSINDLDIEYQSLNQFDKNLPKAIILPAPPELSLEDIIVLSEPIVGSTNSQLCDFIAKLDNLHWVKSGKEEYLKEHQTKCPFCQKETIDESFRSELSALFDKTYEHGVEKVQAIESSYCQNFARYIDSIKTEFTNCSMYDQEQHDVEPLIELLERAYQDNLDLIKSKVKSPSLGVELNDCSDKLNPINKLADEINKLVDSVALKIKKFEENEKDIRNRMWDSLRYHTDGIFSLKQRIVEEKSSEIRLLENKLERVKLIGLKVANRISTLRSKTSNIDDTIDRINESLKSLGITGFEIIASREQEQKNYFVLSRGGSSTNPEGVFHSLSEGEKTLITFLYFIEICNGSLNKGSTITDMEKVIVIDDPISSLSQNYIYDIASLIHSKVVKGNRFKKVIVLTHSLFFFHELIKLAPNNPVKFNEKYSLYRLSKNEYSKVYLMNKDELKNDYQSLWQTVKDVVDGRAATVVLPNVMRNIIEYYFGFVRKKSKLADVLNELTEKEMDQGHKAFYRYINRGSHSDPTNIGLMVDVAPDVYLERFRLIFVTSNEQEHYDSMMHS